MMEGMMRLRKFEFGKYNAKNLRRGMKMRDEVAAAKAKKEFLFANFEEVEGPLGTKCWRWMRGLNEKGYGRVSMSSTATNNMAATTQMLKT
jgi:hypothetical protein